MNDQSLSVSDPMDVWVEHSRGRIFSRVWGADEGKSSIKESSPIVMFHDSLGCVELWRDFPALLNAVTGRVVIAYDRLGFGKSDPRSDHLDLDFIADEAKSYFQTIREQLGFNHFIAFGHSVGGGMAVNCAAEFADACEALITESAQAFPEDKTLQSISEAKAQFKESSQLKRLEKYHGTKAEWVVDAWTESWLHPDFVAWSLKEVLPRVTCPVLAIHGIHDEYGSRCHPEIIAGLSGGQSRFEILDDTYHVPHRECGEVVVDLVRHFII